MTQSFVLSDTQMTLEARGHPSLFSLASRAMPPQKVLWILFLALAPRITLARLASALSQTTAPVSSLLLVPPSLY